MRRLVSLWQDCPDDYVPTVRDQVAVGLVILTGWLGLEVLSRLIGT
jgi:hypothetical protein